MPRPFTETEREEIRAALIATARTHFGNRGYRKVNVAEIAREAGIGKGSVYLFFDSKASLFMAVAEVVEVEVREAYVRASAELSLPTARDRLKHLLSFHGQALNRDPFLQVALDPEETGGIFGETPPSVSEAHRRADVAFFEQLLASWKREGVEHTIDASLLTSAVRALFIVLLNRELIGSDRITQVFDVLADGVARTLTQE
jgi:AcrR family transcriptional regulator